MSKFKPGDKVHCKNSFKKRGPGTIESVESIGGVSFSEETYCVSWDENGKESNVSESDLEVEPG